jgi:glycosyltransferase involved in cell wall biosynthesis
MAAQTNSNHRGELNPLTKQIQPVSASVVIASRDRPLELSKCLQSVSRAISPGDEIIVVDSASVEPESIREAVAKSGAQLFRLERAGAARARNWGIRQARGEIIALTDDDALVDPQWLDALAKRFSEPAVSAVVGPVFELESEPARLLHPPATFDAGIERISFSRSDPHWFEKVRDGPIGFGANLAVRRSVFESHGLFRESLGAGAPIGGDENYFLLALIENGGLVVNEPSARVFHPRQTDERRLLSNDRLAYLLYVLLTRPHLRLPLIANVLKKVSRRNRVSALPATSSSSILRELVSAPTLLLRALSIDRSGNGRRASPRGTVPW